MQDNNSEAKAVPEKKFSLFREKSLEAVESPESLNDYLRVTSPGVWLVLGAVVALLVGAVLWGVFGHISTTASLAVVADGESCVCYVPYDILPQVVSGGSVAVDGESYALTPGPETETVIVSEETSPYLRVAGGLGIGDVAVVVPVDADLDAGVYTGTVVTESLRPMSLLLQ